jgi:hypothetical protein
VATFSVTTTAEQDAAAKYEADRYNATSGAVPLTTLQYAKVRIDQLFNGMVDRWRESTRVTKAEAYAKATPEDQAAVDLILAKYQA